MATDLLAHFTGSSPPPRFVTTLRRVMSSLDTLNEGRLDAEDVEYALNRAGLPLDKAPMRSLLEALDLDGSGRANCEDLVGFFEAYQLPWYEVLGNLATKICHRLFLGTDDKATSSKVGGAGNGDRAGWKRFGNLRNKLFKSDRSKNGEILNKTFKEIMNKMELGIGADELDRLCEAIEIVGGNAEGGKISSPTNSLCLYREFLKYLMDYGGGEVLEELLGDFQHVIKKQLADQDGGLRVGMKRVMEACAQEDKDKTGRISIDGFRHALQKAGAKVALEDVGRLADYSDCYGDGRVAYKALLIDDLPSPFAPRTHGKRSGRRRSSSSRDGQTKHDSDLGSRRKTRDWAWARSRAVTEARAALAKLSKKGEATDVVQKAFKDFDEQGEGTVRTEDMNDIFLLFGANTDPTDIRDLAQDLYDMSDGNSGGFGGGRKCIPYENLVQVLLLSNAEFKSRFPGPMVKDVGEKEKQVLYGKLAERKGIRVVAHKMPKDDKTKKSTAEDGLQGSFIAECKKVDYKETGFISPQSVKTIFTQLKQEMRVRELKALIDK